MKHIPIFILATLTLSACAASGELYKPVKAYDGQSKVVIYNAADYATIPVGINGDRTCDLQRGGFFVYDAQPNHPLTVTMWTYTGQFGDFTFTPRSGQTYYVKGVMNMSGLFNGLYTFRNGSEAEASQTKEGC